MPIIDIHIWLCLQKSQRWPFSADAFLFIFKLYVQWWYKGEMKLTLFAHIHSTYAHTWAYFTNSPKNVLTQLQILPPGLQESTNEPARTFSAHPDKIYIIRFHPTASDVLTTAAHDLSVKIWDLSPESPVASIVLTGHTDQIFALDWSPCGEYLATVCKDGLIRVSR